MLQSAAFIPLIIFISPIKHWQTKIKQKKTKKNNIELDSQNCHVEQTAIERAISSREKPEKSQITLVLAVNLFTRIGMRTLGNLNEK